MNGLDILAYYTGLIKLINIFRGLRPERVIQGVTWK